MNAVAENLDDDVSATHSTGFKGEKSIEDFALSAVTKQHLLAAGFETLFPVQVQSFDTMASGKDLMGRSKTGSGKTLAFALPIIERIRQSPRVSGPYKPTPRALVLLPTRELSSQVAAAFQQIAPDLKIVNVVGGVSYDVQRQALRRGVDVLVGTPGRLIDTMDQQALDMSSVEIAVLDEADMMLKVGFQEAVERIFRDLPETRQTVLWSATFPKWVSQVSKQFLKTPEWLDLVGSEELKTPETVTHKAICIGVRHRSKILASLIDTHGKGGQCLIFTETKRESDELRTVLDARKSRVLHGDLSQSQRQDTIKGFREGRFQTIVCTDIAARGLDIANVDLVIHYRLPNDRENFVHRSGRTGRAGRKGTNLVLFQPDESQDVRHLEREYGLTFAQVAIPSAETLVTGASTRALSSLAKVTPRTTAIFASTAQELLAREDPVTVVAQALAIVSGFGENLPQDYSFVSGAPASTTYRLSLKDTRLEDVLSTLNATAPLSAVIRRTHVHKVDAKTYLVDVVSGTTWSSSLDFDFVPLTALQSLHPGLSPQGTTRGAAFGYRQHNKSTFGRGQKSARGRGRGRDVSSSFRRPVSRRSDSSAFENRW